MSISLRDESTIIRWLFGEILFYKNDEVPITPRTNLDWANRLRFQKIIFNIAEEQNIPITRSWYLWGGYVHSPIMEPGGYENQITNFAAHPNMYVKLRAEVSALSLDRESIINELIKQTDYFTSSSSREFLPKYYQEKTPEQYTNLYLSKQYLNDVLYDFSRIDVYEEDYFYKIKSFYNKQFYDFYLSSNEIIDENRINNTKDDFYTIVNTAIDKVEVQVIQRTNVMRSILRFFSDVYDNYKTYIWFPYATRVSQKTLTGVRAKTERISMAEKEFYSIQKGTENIRSLGFKLEKENIEPTYEEYKLISSHSKITPEINEAIGALFRLYRRSEDDPQ